QAEDGIRDKLVTGVQTCALPIYAWHRLRPWPDSVAGLTRLKKKFIIAPLSNGNISLMTDLAKYSGLPWDCILGAELVHHYKPDRSEERRVGKVCTSPWATNRGTI